MRRFPRLSIRLPSIVSRGIQHARLVAAGGRWSTQVPVTTRRPLRWLLLDGILANISDALLNTYQAVYLLALGATRGEIGILSSLSNLTVPLAMLPGARIAERSRQYKWAVLVPALIGRTLLLGLAFLPLLSTRAHLIQIGMGFLVLRTFLLNLLNPAWTALVGELVPPRWRGRYFSSRNIAMGLTAFLVLSAIGAFIDRVGELQGYQWTLGIAAILGWASAFAFSKITEPAKSMPAQANKKARHFWQHLKGQRRFLAFCAAAGIWNFFVQVASPFFILYLAERTQANASTIGLISAVATIAALPGQRIFGILSESKGPQWIQRLTGFIIPLVPAIWGFIKRPWQAFPVQIVSGFAWAGYNLAAFNLLLELTPIEERPNFVAFYQSIAGLGMAGGAALGGWIALVEGYQKVFLISAAGRFLAAGFFALTVARTHAIPKLELGKKIGRVQAIFSKLWARFKRYTFKRKNRKAPPIPKEREKDEHGEDGTTNLSRQD